MKFEKLRIVGFKTFVDPTEFVIEPGLTGVVGPNGCGKSNLVEAMRWVMGETSFKSMRASAMDDVIFNGSGGRPARNMAEVSLVVDNASRTAPASFNDADKLEISRRIEREEGSTYRINAREARARDVQLLFADAATGARSPAMVRQGQIGEIIAAKPQARRRVLEDAAGIAGLYSRRHEAELRLKATEDNLVRVEDILRHLDGQVESLSKQARQSVRYKEIAGHIRKAEALLLHLAVLDARGQLQAAERQFDIDTRAVAERTRLQGESARAQAVADHAIQPLREAEAQRAAALQRLQIAREQIDGEERRAKSRALELEARLKELDRDRDRSRQTVEDADRSLTALMAEDNQLKAASEADAGGRPAAATHLQHVEADLAKAEQALTDSQGALADLLARKQASERTVREAAERLARAEAQLAQAEREIAAIGEVAGGVDLVALRKRFGDASAALTAAETTQQSSETRLAALRDSENKARPQLAEAERNSQRLETEIRTLKKLLEGAGGDLWPPVVDEMTVAKGYEIALGAAMGDDLDASSNTTAPVHWSVMVGPVGEPALPPQVEPLSKHVKAPPALALRLAQIGVVSRAEGAAFRRLLKPGQRLVSKEGDLWRWDGLTAAAEAPTAAARRLAERNRLGEIEEAATAARATLATLRAEAETVQRDVRAAVITEQDARNGVRTARQTSDQTRDVLAAAERKDAERAARLQALNDNRQRLLTNRDEAAQAKLATEKAAEGFQPDAELNAIVNDRRAVVAQRRADAAEARATLQTIDREIAMRDGRRATVGNEIKAWNERKTRALQQAEEINERVAAVKTEEEALAAAPDDFVVRRRALIHEIDIAEAARKDAADKRAQAETTFADADKIARTMLQDLASSREARARSEALVETGRLRVEEVERAVQETLEVAPSALSELAGLVPGQDLPPLRATEEKLQNLKRERERLGAVNLRADEELQDAEQKRTDLTAEREDLDGAIRKLRRGIQSLNAEGRERLLASFDVVNGHFKRLFATLFGGGEAELQLIESDDPLEAGLEIMAKPPGKKPQVLTLLSGGEQALTATALIFAVFLTNPSPICVLDEIDAPLDDHNVERLCALLDDMVGSTETRFIIITHNPITMARMDRLFGVTMAERGISQLVSVDLQSAEKLVA
ncbi:MAG: chromosome segregation SMC family protein [Beijerinckiaceae bacterium]